MHDFRTVVAVGENSEAKKRGWNYAVWNYGSMKRCAALAKRLSKAFKKEAFVERRVEGTGKFVRV